jgi:predicted metal-dependent hydrolase
MAGPLKRVRSRFSGLLQAILPFDRSDAPAQSPPERQGNIAPPVESPSHALRVAALPAFVLVRHPRARRYVIRVRPDRTVRVTIPRWGSKREGLAFAERQRAWIEDQLRRLDQERAESRNALAPDAARDLRARAMRELPKRLRELAQSLGLEVSRISIRNQKWRWGSCSRDGLICLNWRLVAMPDWVRDYVLIHELMHLKRLDHSPKFWALVAAACPQYKDARAWLRTHEHLLSAAMN